MQYKVVNKCKKFGKSTWIVGKMLILPGEKEICYAGGYTTGE